MTTTTEESHADITMTSLQPKAPMIASRQATRADKGIPCAAFNDGLLVSKVRYEAPPEGANMAKMLWESFARHSSRTLLVDVKGKRDLSGACLRESVARIATNLIRLVGFEAGQVALMLCDHSGDEILMALGLVCAGGAIYGSNPEDGYNEEKMLCQLVRPDVIVTQTRLKSSILRLRKNIPALEGTKIIWLDKSGSSAEIKNGLYGTNRSGTINNNNNNNNNNFDDQHDIDEQLVKMNNPTFFYHLLLDESQPADVKLVEDVIYNKINPSEHVLTYMLTSGSTDRPKVVRSTHEELMHGMYSMISANKNPLDDQDVNEADCCSNANFDADFDQRLLLPISRDSIFAGDLPLDHGAGINTMFLTIFKGCKFIIMPSYKVDTFWQSVHDYRITTSIASTTFTFKLLTRLKELIDTQRLGWDLSCLQLLTCCGSKMAFVELAKEISQHLPQLNICQCYGATEMGFMAMLRPVDCKRYLHSVGHLFPGMCAKVIDVDTGNVCKPNERGELHIWSQSKFKRYMCHQSDDPELMMKRCHDEQGFYITGDQVHYDPEGRLYVHGRFKDTLFLAQDWKILPIELEDVINKHPLVEMSAVIGIPDKDLPGCDAPKAFVKLISVQSASYRQLKSGWHKQKLCEGAIDAIREDIYQFVAARTAAPKHLKGGVQILDELPLVGLLNKVDRKALKLMG